MKKFLKLVLVIMVALTFKIIDVKAVKITIEANDNVAKNKTINVSFIVSEYNGVPGNMTINYPSNLLQCNSNCPKNVSITGNVKLTYQFNTLANGEAIITATSNYNGGDATKKITIGNVTKPQNPTTTQAPQTTKTQEAPKSNNANIKSLTIKANDDSDVVLSPVFNPGVYDYEATVASTVKTVSITPILEDAKSNAVISNNANEELKAGEDNKITITVTAEDGSKKAYNINIKREALTSDATLKNLEIEEIGKFKFDKDKFTYNVKIGKNVKSLTITYELSDENSTVDIEGNSKLKNGSVVKVIVTAQDGTKKAYTLNIQKETNSKKKVVNVAAEKNPLIILGLSMIAFALVGGIIYVAKK